MPRISVPQLHKEIQVAPGAPLMKALLEAGIPVASSCNGDGICGKCKMSALGKEGCVSAPNATEIILKEKFQLEKAQRISCQVVVHEDVEVRTSYW